MLRRGEILCASSNSPGRRSPRGYLFSALAGAAFDGDNFMARVFKPAARHADMPELTFHDLRHTGASPMIAAGCPVKHETADLRRLC